jgi:hypothetical protein
MPSFPFSDFRLPSGAMKILILMTPFLLMSNLARSAEPNFLRPYLEIQTLLAKDTISGITAPAVELEKRLKAEKQSLAVKSAHELQSAKNLNEARESFLKISKAILPWARKHQIKGIVLAYCPMKPGHWLQKAGDLRNPYYGAEMLECGVVEEPSKK